MTNIITGYKFAEISNVVFSGIFLKSQIDSLDLSENVEDYIAKNEYIFIRKKNFTLFENDIIFCKTEFVYELFNILKNFNKFKNLKLITHQSDKSVNKKMYDLKPECISTWYAVNVDYKAKDLVPIPIGVANFHSKNLNQNDFSNELNKSSFIQKKKSKLYLNFNPNTNFLERKKLLEDFEICDWTSVDKSPINHKAYKQNLQDNSFVMAPWGNGIDTHRFWETLYSGSIPITKLHHMYEAFESLPKLLVNDYRVVTKEYLQEYLEYLNNNINSYSFEQLDFEYWKNKILDYENNIDNDNSYNFKNNKYFYYGYKVELRHYLDSKLKFFNRLRRYIYKRFGI